MKLALFKPNENVSLTKDTTEAGGVSVTVGISSISERDGESMSGKGQLAAQERVHQCPACL